MKFGFAAAAVAAVSADAEIIQLFLGKPADESMALELDEIDQTDEALELAGVDACDPEIDPCQVYGLVALDASGDDMAVVNLGLWDDLKKKASEAASTVQRGASAVVKGVEKRAEEFGQTVSRAADHIDLGKRADEFKSTVSRGAGAVVKAGKNLLGHKDEQPDVEPE